MSTSATVRFGNFAAIYLHYDGYPEGVLSLWESFIDELENVDDKRFSDMPYLSAKFLVFCAREFRADDSHYLDFLSVGIVNPSHIHTDYVYYVQVIETPDGYSARLIY